MYYFTVFLMAILTMFFGLLTALLVCVPMFFVCWGVMAILQRMQHVKNMVYYANHIENIYVWSSDENDITVRQRAAHERTMLNTANNQLNVTVHELYFRDVGFTNETWEQFQERVAQFIAEDREKRHKFINSKGREFFVTYILEQQ